MRISIAQLNPLVGDLYGNAQKIISACEEASIHNSNLLISPELSLWGYPPKDLLLNPILIKQQQQILNELVNNISKNFPGLKILIGIAEPIPDLHHPKLFNSIALVDGSQWEVIARKQLLPNHDVFDDKRYFRSSKEPGSIKLTVNNKSVVIGITICEDIWVEEDLQTHRTEGADPIEKLMPQNIDLLINLSASPFTPNKEKIRYKIAEKAVQRLKCPMIYLNQVGGNDELVFDGGSFVLNKKGQAILKLPEYLETIIHWDTEATITYEKREPSNPQKQLFQALSLGVGDYSKKCGFDSALIGLSGGIDSSLVAIIAASAMGAKKVTGVLMPSPWSSDHSIIDATNLAERIGINTHILPIKDLMHCYDQTLSKPLGKLPNGLTAENLQSRIRGTLLMALANQEGHLLLSTGNKSELAVGYCTLYGDMNGGLSVIGDLYKTSIFDLCKWLDSPDAYLTRKEVGLPNKGVLIGKEIINKEPSAELRENQLDSDSLPDYSVLDPILKSLIEERLSTEALINKGYDQSLVSEIQKMMKKAEFKRLQAPPLLKMSNQAFGSGWRVPIAAT